MTEEVWKKVPRVSRTIPFGYKLDSEDPDVLLPIPLELEALELAKKHVKVYSYRVVADWLSEVTGRKISHVGLDKRIKSDRTRRAQAVTSRQWAKWYEKVAQKARDLEEKVGVKG